MERGAIELIQAEELWVDDGSADHSGWFCVRTDPFPCPALVGRNPRIEEYASEYGPSASYYAWEAAGGPVHGVRAP